ncbi:SAC3 family protein B-like protein [Drosera capensis]
MKSPFKGFGKSSGPTAPPSTQPPFGPDSPLFQPSPPLALSGSGLPVDTNGQLALPGMRTPPFPLVSNQFSVNAQHSTYDAPRPVMLLNAWGNHSNPVSNNNHSNRRSRSPIEKADVPAYKQLRSHYLSSTGDTIPRSSQVNQQVSERRSLSPPKLTSKKNVTGSPDFLDPKSSGAAHHMSSDNGVDRRDYGQTRRTSPVRQTFQENFSRDLDGTKRELQAKAMRLARFKNELSDPVEQVSNFPKQTLASTTEKLKHVGDFSSGTIRDLSDDMDNEGGDSPSIIVGSCPDMCPESERAERERKGDLDQYERVDGDRNQTSKSIAVKKYNRTAEREAELIRPLPILQKTMGHLLNLLDQQYDDSFLGLYNFLWDRMRAVRMDLRMQHIFNLEAITMLEQMIRLHIIAMHELCEYTKGEGFSEGFDAHLNIEQMNKTSVELFQLYDDHRKKGLHVPTEKEFRGYYALLKLDKHPGYKVEPAELSLDLAKMTPEIRQTQEVLFAREVARTGNFIAFFRLARKATYLQACLMHAHFSKLRTQALASLHSGLQNNQGLPVAHVAKWLGMEGEDIESLLDYHGFSIKEFEEPYMVKDGSFLNSDQDYLTLRSVLVHSKKSEVIVDDVLYSGQASMPLAVNANKPRILADKNKRLERQSKASGRTLVVRDEEMTDSQVSSPRERMLTLPTVVPHGRVDGPKDVASSPRGIGPVHTAFSISSSHQHAWSDSGRAVASPQLGIRQHPPTLAISSSHQYGRIGSPRALSSSSKGVGPLKPAFTMFKGHHHDEGGAQPATTMPRFVPESQKSFLDWGSSHAMSHQFETSCVNGHQSGVISAASHIKPRTAEQDGPAAPLFDSAAMSTFHNNQVIVEDPRNAEPNDVQNDEDGVVPVSYDKEVAEAKLKLFVRLWRRRYIRRRELREQNRIAAASALDSLSLGPTFRQINSTIPMTYGKLNIDQVMETRFDMHERSWSRLNASDVVAGKLSEINANANCICWKVVLSSASQVQGNTTEERNQVASSSALFEWLRCKLMPPLVENNDSLLLSSPGLSIWSKWVSGLSAKPICCLSVVKDSVFGDSSQKLLGASALVYSLDNNIPWDAQKIRLHNLVASLPPESRMPLLILNSSNEQDSSDPSSSVFVKLGLNGIDGSLISNFLIVSLQVDGYFSDERLREGLEWLAANSPPQAVLYSVNVRELVQSHLNSSLDALEQTSSLSIGPERCISVFNKAVDRSMGDVTTAANRNVHGWPCHELSLLDKSSAEHRAVKLFLPAIGWSSAERIGPLISELAQCKLTSFTDDISWLARGSNVREEMEDQRSSLQECLLRYLTTPSKSMNVALAVKEANIMVQNHTRLKLYGTRYYLVPSWIRIFRRVFNWQSNMLPSGASGGVYVLEKPHPAPSPLILRGPGDENNPSSPYHQHLSLDEMIEVSRSSALSRRARPESKASHYMPIMMSNGSSSAAEVAESSRLRDYDAEAAAGDSHLVESERHYSGHELAMEVDGYLSKGLEVEGIMSTLKASREADRLSELLEQCSVLQDKIQEKLQIYF